MGRFFFVLPPPLKPEQQKVFGNVNDTISNSKSGFCLFSLSLRFIYLFYCIFSFEAGTEVKPALLYQQTSKLESPRCAGNAACAGANAETLAESVNKGAPSP